MGASLRREADAAPSRRREFPRRIKGCLGLDRRDALHPLAEPLVARKRGSAGRRAYRALVAEAQAGAVPGAVIRQIQLDVARTFPAIPASSGAWGWPNECPDREARLARVLMAFECRALDSLGKPRSGLPMLLKIRRSWCGFEESEPLVEPQTPARQAQSLAPSWTVDTWQVDPSPVTEPVPTYVQGCSMMAAMCLGFTAGEEEEGFWLFTYLLEDVLGSDFFSRSPALLGYHGDRAACAQLVATQCPRLAQRLGEAGLAECVSALAARCLLSGFVGFLSGPVLVAFWEELLQMPCADFPRLPLLLWLAGLVQHVERALLLEAGSPGLGVGPRLFKRNGNQTVCCDVRGYVVR
ncbi:unnamed protein product [Effrenium voratum]|nr:unnamed protein product [Effrenium voratum]